MRSGARRKREVRSNLRSVAVAGALEEAPRVLWGRGGAPERRDSSRVADAL